MEFTGKKVLIVGTGKSGVAAAELLQKKQADLIIFDGNKELKEEQVKEKSGAFSDAEIVLGELPESVMEKLDLVVLSPGVPTDLPMVNAIRDKKIPIIGEIELAYQCAKGKILAITGTNGKTTTTALLGEIMKNYFSDVKVVGNIGIPYTSVAADTTEETVTVAEISSFQLETAVEFRPEVSAILNITPDHLNRHHTMENYIAAKESITKNQTADDIWVCIDTSGSVTGEELTCTMAEILDAMRQAGLKGSISFFDSNITEPEPFESENDLKNLTAQGGGGTSFHIIFRYLKEKLYPNLPRAILIFTDGCARFPDEKEAFNVPVLWLICKGGNADVPWGQVIQL